MSPLSRRFFLRGTGVAMALPMLDAMQPRVAAAADEKPPVRSAFVFFPNGTNIGEWKPKGFGRKYRMSPSLASLEPYRDDILMLSGLAQDGARSHGDGGGDHARNASSFLTCAHPVKTGGADIRAGQSIDQTMAEVIGQQTRLPSLELGIEPSRHSGRCDSGYSCAYQSNISWKSETLPTAKEIHPRFVFERLFGSQGGDKEVQRRRLLMRQSILDYVADDSKRLTKQVGTSDRQKLDEFFTSVRDVEQRLERTIDRSKEDGNKREKIAPLPPAKTATDQIRLMYDLMVLAFRTDTTRIATFMLANGSSNRSYTDVGVQAGHHQLSHHRNDPDKMADIAKIDRYLADQFAYFLGRLQETKDGEGRLMDNVMVMYGSGIADGNRHNHDDIPLLLAGQGGGLIQTGRHLNYGKAKKGEDRGSAALKSLQSGETPTANLYLSMLRGLGMETPRFGDSSGTLPGLS